MSIVATVERFIERERLLERGDVLLVAVSGGPDSTALLHILTELAADWSFSLHVAHMDHGFRGEESRREAEWVRSLSERLGWPCTVRHEDIPQAVMSAKGNPQDVARQIRYSFLIETAKRIKADAVVLGHHADDQAETVLLRLIRGASLTGIAGMSPVAEREGVKLVRPLLRIYKEDIYRYMHDRGHGYCTDSSNLKRTYARNRLRLDVMPLLREFNPDLAQTLNRMADILRAEDRFLHELTEREASRLFRRSQSGFTASRDELLKLDVALQRRVIKLILSYLCKNRDQTPYTSVHIEKIREAIRQSEPPSLTLHLPGSVFVREYDLLRFAADGHDSAVRFYAYRVDDANGSVTIGEAGAVLQFSTHDEMPASWLEAGHDSDRRCAYFDMDELEFPLTVRNRRPGDRIRLMNMEGTKKLKDLFIDLKVPPGVRDEVPLVFDAAGRLLWVCGIRRSCHALIRPNTKKVLRIRFEQNESMSSNIDYLGG